MHPYSAELRQTHQTGAGMTGNIEHSAGEGSSVAKSNGYREKRKAPRIYMDLPVEFRIMDAPHKFGALVDNGSEVGLRIHSVKTLAVGTRLVVAVMFPKEYQLSNFEALAEVVWKDLYWEEDWEGYQYGLRFLQIREEDLLKFRQLMLLLEEDREAPHSP